MRPPTITLAMLTLLAACKRDVTEHAAEDKAPVESCVADELGALVSGWDEIEVCETDSESCRDQCRDGDGDACFHLAITLQTGKADDRTQELYLRACKLGLATGCTNWAAGAWIDELGPSVACVDRVFSKTCAVGDSYGCAMLGRILIETRTSVVDLVRGQMFLNLACAQHAVTCNLLAMYYDNDTFGAPDLAKAAALRKQACEAGNDSACGDEPPDTN